MEKTNFKISKILMLLFISTVGFGQSISFDTYMNPVIPGDHPDPTLTRVGNDFYTTGSSFNPTPKIYHSTDLVHWEVIAQPAAAWSDYGNAAGEGAWGGHMVFYNDTYWDYFGLYGGTMYFVTADQPEGPWSTPTEVNVPSSMSGLGIDNSIFIDEDEGKWYLLTKNGRANNHIVELGDDGQPTGVVLDLTWLNPESDGYPYSWAEGPVMWKYNGYYYYSFAQYIAGNQYVMRSDTLTDDESDWTIIGSTIFTGSKGTFSGPNHISPAVLLDDSTSWIIVQSYGSDEWYAEGRQGLLCQLTYDEDGFPEIQYPSDEAEQAPDLPSSGIPWMVPKSDMFDSSTLDPEWSFLGYASAESYSLTERDGWLYLKSRTGGNTIIKNDGEHNYSLITRMDFEPGSNRQQAGMWIFNGSQSHYAKLYSTLNSDGDAVLIFSLTNDSTYQVENTVGSVVWLKIIRDQHTLSGYYSSDGNTWTQIGNDIEADELDADQGDYNSFTGNQQGLYVNGKAAYFDLYIYRDAYTQIDAQCPANQYGTSGTRGYLDDIEDGEWALYAGVEFGGSDDYNMKVDSLEINASSASSGGTVEVWLDSLDTGTKIAECTIEGTGSLSNYETFTAEVDSASGRHDVYLKFVGSSSDELFRIDWFQFLGEMDSVTSVGDEEIDKSEFYLNQNYPNPFNPTTSISYSIPSSGHVSLKVYNMLGQEVRTLYNGLQKAGEHSINFNAKGLASGVYLYRLTSGNYVETKKLVLLK